MWSECGPAQSVLGWYNSKRESFCPKYDCWAVIWLHLWLLWSIFVLKKTAGRILSELWLLVLRFGTQKKAVDLKTQRDTAPNMTAEDGFAPINDSCTVFWSWLWPLIRIWTARKALIPHVNVLEWFGPKKKTAERKTVPKERPLVWYASKKKSFYQAYECFEMIWLQMWLRRWIQPKILLLWKLWLQKWLLKVDFNP